MTIRRSNYRGTHRYACDAHAARDLPGATTVMKALAAPGLEFWKADQLLRIVLDRLPGIPAMLDGDGLEATLSYFHKAAKGAGGEARDRGTDVHAAVEAIVKGREPVATPGTEGHVEGFRRWIADKGPVFRQAEFMVVSETHGYGATGDLAFTLGGEYWGADVKTGKLLPETGLQLAAIRFADHAGRAGDPTVYPVPQTTRHGVLLVHEDGTELVPFDIRPDREWEAFLACLRLHRYEREKRDVIAA